MKPGIAGKALCYMAPLFLTPFVDKSGDYLLQGLWMPAQLVVYCTLVGLVNMFIGGRAFFDGSAERDKIETKASELEPPTDTTKTP